MKTLYIVTIRKDYTELEFQFEHYWQALDLVKLIVDFSDYEAGIKKIQLPFSESEVEE